MSDDSRRKKVEPNYLDELLGTGDKERYKILNETMSFDDYVTRVIVNPAIVRNAYQRVYDMIIEKGSSTFERYRKVLTHYNFFDDPESPIFGLEDTLNSLVNFFRGAAGGYGSEKRILLLHGPVGSSKSTICRRLKRGLEKYSRTDAGSLYTYRWKNLPPEIYNKVKDTAAMHEDPILFIPTEDGKRDQLLRKLNERWLELTPEDKRASQYPIFLEGDVNPRSKAFIKELLSLPEFHGDLLAVLRKHIEVVRIVYSEADRVGIGTFQPKDEKNQDATELTGDVNFAQLQHYGSDSDGRAFNFDGEFCAANRGMLEFIEALKLAKEFLYDLLEASQGHVIKPKKFSQVSIDEVIIAHTNSPEFERLTEDKTMEALRDRTVKIDVPYLLRISDEVKIYQQDYKDARQHIAPHTLEMAAFFAVMTRLVHEAKPSPRSKIKLYDGKILPGYSEELVKEMHDRNTQEGLKTGLSARYIQDQISATLSERDDYINPFMVLNKLYENLRHSSLITNEEDIRHYELCVEETKKELEEVLKKEVQKALVTDENAIIRLCTNYIDNLMAFVGKKKIRNPVTQEDEAPNEKLMRSIEEKIGVPENKAEDFRLSVSSFIAQLAHKGQTFAWNSDPQLQRALEKKLFEDVKDHIKLSMLSSDSLVVDKDQQEKIDAVKARLIKHYGYNEKSATDVLSYVSQIFARGDSDSDD